MSPFRIVLLLVLLWSPIQGKAGEISISTTQNTEFQSEINFDTSAFASYRSHREFQYNSIPPSTPGILELAIQLLRKLFGPLPLPDYLIKGIIYLVAGSLIFLLVWIIVRNRLRNILERPSSKIPVSNFGLEILESPESLKMKLAIASDEGNFKLAVRYLFILLLIQLNENNHIKADIYKTDRDYLDEIDNMTLKKHYKDLSILFEYVWYGDFKIDRNTYLKIQQKFEEAKMIME